MNRTLKHTSPTIPSSRTGARWKLAYGKFEWPACYSYRLELMRKEERRLTCRQKICVDNTSANVPTDKLACASASPNVQSSNSASRNAVIALMVSTKLLLSVASPPKTRCLAALSSPLRWSKKSHTHSSPSFTAADGSRTQQKFGSILTVEVISSIANSP